VPELRVTPLRIRAIELVKQHPGIYLGTLAEKLEYRGFFSWGARITGTAQGATRWGGGYAAPFVRAGLMRKDSRVDCGGARLYITPAGEQWLQEALLTSGLQGN
jgi:hypothetical protein